MLLCVAAGKSHPIYPNGMSQHIFQKEKFYTACIEIQMKHTATRNISLQ